KLMSGNPTVPAGGTTGYSTWAEGQPAILINIDQGERELTRDNKLLGTFKLAGIPPMPAGLPQVDVTFLVNENGMLTVSAKEQRSGQQASVTVQAAHGLSPDEVDKLVLESVEHAREDFTTRQLVEFKNKGEADVRYTRKMLAETGDRLTAAEQVQIKSAIERVESAIAMDDLGALGPAVGALQEATTRLATEGLNAVIKQVLAGKTEAELKAGK